MFTCREQVFTVFKDKYIITGDMSARRKLCMRKRTLCRKIADKKQELSESTDEKIAESSYGLPSHLYRKIACANNAIV